MIGNSFYQVQVGELNLADPYPSDRLSRMHVP